MNQDHPRPRIYIITNNHFDLTWRRCRSRRLQWQGKEWVSYDEVQQYYFEDNLALAAKHPEYKFEAECTAVVRQFLRRCPQRRKELQDLVKAGRFTVAGAGDNVIDGVLGQGENLIRNFTTGLLWLEKELGIKPALAIRNDAFGNPAQLPQILRGCGLRWVHGLSYADVKGRYWRGMDGSVVCTDRLPSVGWPENPFVKYAPCPKCAGKGCAHCRNRGIDPRQPAMGLPKGINESLLRRVGAGWIGITPEEALPLEGIVEWARQKAEKTDARFALQEEMRPHSEEWIAKTDDPPPGEVHPGVELLPAMSGCWVTRIRLKQELRRLEYRLRDAETWTALTKTGADDALASLWENLLFTVFHDAITATHVDAAYAELMDVNRTIDRDAGALADRVLATCTCAEAGTVSVLNPLGMAVTTLVRADLPQDAKWIEVTDASGRRVPVVSSPGTDDARAMEFVAPAVPPLGASVFRVRPMPAAPAVRRLEQPAIENTRFRIKADAKGLIEIFDKTLGLAVSGRSDVRPNEMIIETDVGSPWSTLLPDQGRARLADATQLVSAEAGETWQRLRFHVPQGKFGHFTTHYGVEIRSEVLLVDGLDRVEFCTTVEWDCYNVRLRVGFPVPVNGVAWYGVPYGMLSRGSYTPSFGWAGTNGDWPAIEWAGVQGQDLSVAVLDRGIPSRSCEKCQGGSLLTLSLLRSPANPTYLHEPHFYSMTDYDGMRDAGRHVLRYALTAYDRAFADSTVVADAEAFNSGLVARAGRVTPPPAPRVVSEGVRLGAVKPADDRVGIVLRLAECRGRATEAVVELPASTRKATLTDLRERPVAECAIAGNRAKFPLRAWEIATMRLE